MPLDGLRHAPVASLLSRIERTLMQQRLPLLRYRQIVARHVDVAYVRQHPLMVDPLSRIVGVVRYPFVLPERLAELLGQLHVVLVVVRTRRMSPLLRGRELPVQVHAVEAILVYYLLYAVHIAFPFLLVARHLAEARLPVVVESEYHLQLRIPLLQLRHRLELLGIFDHYSVIGVVEVSEGIHEMREHVRVRHRLISVYHISHRYLRRFVCHPPLGTGQRVSRRLRQHGETGHSYRSDAQQRYQKVFLFHKQNIFPQI